ncbi:MAG: hypothetical protein ACP5OR_02645 [Candidatus Dormibacteria bacterium]
MMEIRVQIPVQPPAAFWSEMLEQFASRHATQWTWNKEHSSMVYRRQKDGPHIEVWVRNHESGFPHVCMSLNGNPPQGAIPEVAVRKMRKVMQEHLTDIVMELMEHGIDQVLNALEEGLGL